MKKLTFYMFLMLGFVLSTKSVLAQRIGGDEHMGYYNMMDGGGHGGFGWIFLIIFWALIIFGVVMAVKYFPRNEHKQIQDGTLKKEKSPLEVLKHRYAKGEINKEEYDKVKKDLE